MDPTANLQEQLGEARQIARCNASTHGGGECHCNPEYLAELVIALDEWIRKRGFLPEPWGRASDGHWAKKGGA